MALSVVILAAGSGTRMQSNLPKVLHPLGGLPMLERVIRVAKQINPKSIHVVFGAGGDEVTCAMQHMNVSWVHQEKQLGTGHALAQVIPELDEKDQVLVLFGDVPLITPQTLSRLIEETPPNGLGVVISELDNPAGFGRIIRSHTGNIVAIVEHRDANEQQLEIKEINTGIMTGSVAHFKEWLPQLKDCNTQHEFYLTDAVALAVHDGVYVGAVMAPFEEVRGVNDRWQLAQLESVYQLDQARLYALSGVTILDYHRVSFRGHISIEKDVRLDVNVVMEGEVSVGAKSMIGPSVVLRNCIIGKGCVIKANTVIDGAILKDGVTVGPFSHIALGSTLKQGSEVGSFVEVKQSICGVSSKVGSQSLVDNAQVAEQAILEPCSFTHNK